MKNDILYESRLKKDEYNKDRIRICKCGWKNVITNKNNKKICYNCGNMVYLNKKEEFINRIKQELRKKKDE